MKAEIMRAYREKADALKHEISMRRKRNARAVVAEVVALVFVVGAVVAYYSWLLHPTLLLAAAVFFAGYVGVRRADLLNLRKMEACEDLLAVYQKEVAYHQDDYSGFLDGHEYINAGHAYSFDLDLFGHASLFQRLNRTVSTAGSDTLAAWLSQCYPQTKEAIDNRREVIDELAAREPFRANFMACGQRERIDTVAVRAALSGLQRVNVPLWMGSCLLYGLCVAVVVGFLLLTVLALMGVVSGSVPFGWAMLQFFLTVFCCSRVAKEIYKIVGRVHEQLQRYTRLIALVAGEQWNSREMKALAGRLQGKDASAQEAFGALARLLSAFDLRGNGLWFFLSNSLFMGDFFLIFRFLRWQRRHATATRVWIEAVAQVDALVSMATFRYNEPQAVAAMVVEDDAVVYEAKGLTHPFLGAKAVGNDFVIRDRHYYIITGANMAGKSTFLRAVGINYVLALNGLPVFANSLRISIFSLFSSMRTTDDLTQGISYFNAELLRLQHLMAHCQRSRHTLIILDEILKGTNSLDKLNGSRLFLETMATQPVTGLIATHDLELSKMAEQMPERFHNHCFEIELSERVTYSYKLTPGVARNQNATFLLRSLLQTAEEK